MLGKILILFSNIFLCILYAKVQALENENIIGGFMALPENCTYQVSVHNRDHLCGGALVGPQYIITAAHCLFDKNNNFVQGPVVVTAGTVDLKLRPSTRVEALMDKVYVPIEYSQIFVAPLNADIAVLRLAKYLDLGSNAGLSVLEFPLNIPSFRDISVKEGIFSGFGVDLLRFKPYFDDDGKRIFDGYASEKLHYIVTIMLSDDYCREFFQHTFMPGKHMCGIVRQTSNVPEWSPDGTCDGDSGGPFVYEYNGVKYLVGVLSTGSYDCDEMTSPSIYIPLLPFKDFITRAFNDDCNPDYMYCQKYMTFE